MLNVTGTDYCKCRSQCVLVKLFLFIYLLLRFAYGGVLLMTAFLKIYPIPKIRNIPIYRLAYSIAMYRNISYRNPCIVIRIVSPDSCQYTALIYTHTHTHTAVQKIFSVIYFSDANQNFHQPLQSSVSQNPSEIIPICWFIINAVLFSFLFIKESWTKCHRLQKTLSSKPVSNTGNKSI